MPGRLSQDWLTSIAPPSPFKSWKLVKRNQNYIWDLENALFCWMWLHYLSLVTLACCNPSEMCSFFIVPRMMYELRLHAGNACLERAGERVIPPFYRWVTVTKWTSIFPGNWPLKIIWSTVHLNIFCWIFCLFSETVSSSLELPLSFIYLLQFKS